VAIFHLQINSIGRSAGRRATAAAAYRAGERIRDERSGKVINYSKRKDVLHKEIFLPARLDGMNVDWARDRATLWNTAERTERQSNSRVAREYQVALPPKLTPSQRLELARTFSRELADRYNVAVDLAVHDPRPGGDPRNFHAHLLTTTREVTPTGLGAKTGLDMGSAERFRRELPSSRDEFLLLRERWATLTNSALREANVEARVEHRSLAARGIDREPRPSVPLTAYKIEQRGARSEVAEHLRADYRARVQKRLERAASSTSYSARTAERTHTEQGAASLEQHTADPRDVEEIRRQAREAWLRLRPKEAERAPGNAADRATDHERDDVGKDAVPLGRRPEDDFAL